MDIDWKDRTDGKTVKIPLNYDLFMNDNVKFITDWIKSYNQKYEIRYVIMYHAANKNAPILERGLLAGKRNRKNFGMSESGYVYLAVNPQTAKIFGEMAYNENYIIYEVIVPVGKLLPDKKRLQYTMPEGVTGGSLAHSLIYAGSAMVKGNIERWQIKQYEEESRSNSEKPSLLIKIEHKKQEVKKYDKVVSHIKSKTALE